MLVMVDEWELTSERTPEDFVVTARTAAFSRTGVRGLWPCEASDGAPRNSASRGNTRNLTLANPERPNSCRMAKFA